MLATIASAALQGIDAEIVHVEVNAGEAGEPKLFLVGLPDTAVTPERSRGPSFSRFQTRPAETPIWAATSF